MTEKPTIACRRCRRTEPRPRAYADYIAPNRQVRHLCFGCFLQQTCGPFLAAFLDAQETSS